MVFISFLIPSPYTAMYIYIYILIFMISISHSQATCNVLLCPCVWDFCIHVLNPPLPIEGDDRLSVQPPPSVWVCNPTPISPVCQLGFQYKVMMPSGVLSP